MSRNNNSNGKQKTPLLTHLVAGGAAGLMEACSCHPLDTIKVRMQLSKSGSKNANVSIPFSLLLVLSLIYFIPGTTTWIFGCGCQNCEK